jgi:hypothetical protein
VQEIMDNFTFYKKIVQNIFTYGAETWSIKYRRKLLATEMDYLGRSARISRMDEVVPVLN